MAKRNRRGGSADEYDDEPFDDAGDDDRDQSRDGSTVVQERSTATATRRGGFGPVGRFVREVVAELRKVIWPTRKELVTYAVVVVFFIAVMMVIIAGYDYAFASAVQWVFGN